VVVNNTWERIHLNLGKNQILRTNTFFTCTNLSICELFNDEQLTPQYACETISLLNLKVVCCKAIFQLYKCMYGLKCYQLYHVLLVCRLFPNKNVYSSILFLNYIMISCKYTCMASVGLWCYNGAKQVFL
jgi:hypothetical protein